jgi:hypothetical protein
MRFARIAVAFAAMLTLAYPVSASASDNPTFDQKVAALVAASQKNFTATYETENEVPYTFRIQDKQRWEMLSIEGNNRVIGQTEYVALNAEYLARAAAGKKKSWKWYSSKNFQPAPTVMTHAGRFLVTAKYGTVTRDGNAYVVRSAFEHDKMSFEEVMTMGPTNLAEYRVTLDNRGRIAAVAGWTSQYMPGYEEPFKMYSSARFSYNSVTVPVPSRSSVASMFDVDALPPLHPLDEAAITTAYDANVFAAQARSSMTVDLITEAATGVVTPDGLEATYLTNGLKFSMDGRSLCVLVTKDRKKAVVTRC